MADNSRHSSETNEYYTPPDILEKCRSALEGFDLDPAGNDKYAHVVGAGTYYKQEDDGLRQPWFGNVWLNPPGGRAPVGTGITRSNSALWWHVLSLHYLAKNVGAAFFLGFSLEQLQSIQKLKGLRAHPLYFPTVFLHTRICFLDEDLIPQKQPSHSNFLTLLPPRDAREYNCISAFRLHFENEGEFINV